MQTWDRTHGLTTQKQPISSINVPRTVRKGSYVYGLSRHHHTRQGAVSGPVDCSGRSRALRISKRRGLHGGVSSVRRTWISGVEISSGRFSRYRARDFARSNHSSRRLALPISRPTTVIITPPRYPESPGSSRTAHGAAHGTSRRTAPTMLMADLDREVRFPLA